MSPSQQETADLVKFTEEILNGKLHFLCSHMYWAGSSEIGFYNDFYMISLY